MIDTYIGVDLATQPVKTGVCVLEWPVHGRPQGRFVEVAGRTDVELVKLFKGASAVAIDVPFGWPAAFRSAIEMWSKDQVWEGPGYDDKDVSERLRYRETDRECARRVREAVRRRRENHKETLVKLRLPQVGISVSTNWLGATALRGAGLLAQAAHTEGIRFDRGSDRPEATSIVEAYPAAALASWDRTWAGLGFEWPDVPARDEFKSRIDFEEPDGLENRDNFDAVVCALVARAWHLGCCVPATEMARGQQQEEGWIALPTCSLDDLFSVDL